MKSINILLTILFLTLFSANISVANSAAEINAKAELPLKHLYNNSPGAKTLANDAKAILVFSEIVKAGLIVGGQLGDGVLLKNGEPTAYYRSVAASYGLQAGVQKFGYALFFMDNDSLDYLEKSKGWEIGSGPSVVVVDEGFGKKLSSTTLKKGVYAYIFDQKGLMAGIGIEGSKITKITPDN